MKKAIVCRYGVNMNYICKFNNGCECMCKKYYTGGFFKEPDLCSNIPASICEIKLANEMHRRNIHAITLKLSSKEYY